MFEENEEQNWSKKYYIEIAIQCLFYGINMLLLFVTLNKLLE